VVDMLYFPLIEGHFPSWSPIWANEQFLFFRPVFNIADTAISVGVGLLILFQRSFFSSEVPSEAKKVNQNQE
jgi:signal peptidase II